MENNLPNNNNNCRSSDSSRPSDSSIPTSDSSSGKSIYYYANLEDNINNLAKKLTIDFLKSEGA